MIGEGGGEAKKRKKPHKNCRRYVENGGDLGGKRKRRRKERVGPVAANADNLENNKGAWGVSTRYPSRESVPPLSRLIRGFRTKYH